MTPDEIKHGIEWILNLKNFIGTEHTYQLEILQFQVETCLRGFYHTPDLEMIPMPDWWAYPEREIRPVHESWWFLFATGHTNQRHRRVS